MSFKSSQFNQKPSSFSFAPSISFESLVWTIVQQIALSPVALPETANTERIHTIALELIQFFDDIVYSILSTSESLPIYEAERTKIISAWRDEQSMAKQVGYAHDLFRLTMKTLSMKRLFKVKQYSYFRLGFVRGEGASIEEIQTKESQFADDN